jgi:hypothetical protein
MNNNSSLNTGLLIVIVILLIIGGFWYLSSHKTQPQPQEDTAGIEINLPDGTDTNNGGDDNTGDGQ